jgi:hypothetical protein
MSRLSACLSSYDQASFSGVYTIDIMLNIRPVVSAPLGELRVLHERD